LGLRVKKVFSFRPEREEEDSSVDVFSKEGIYLSQMNWSFISSLIKNGFLYDVRENEDTEISKSSAIKLSKRIRPLNAYLLMEKYSLLSIIPSPRSS
jgi:hypothetical protein